MTFHRLDDSTTRVTTQMDVDPEGFVENAADKAGILDQRVKGDLKRFKEFIEQRGQETGAWRGDIDRPRPRTHRHGFRPSHRHSRTPAEATSHLTPDAFPI